MKIEQNDDIEIFVTIHPTEYKSKPTNVGELVNDFVHQEPQYMRPEELAQEMLKGKTLLPAGICARKTSDQVFASNSVCLDFDGDLKFIEFKHICEDINIKPVFCYSTFSSSFDSNGYPDRYRAIFYLEKEICNTDVKGLYDIWTSKEHEQWKRRINCFFHLFGNKADKKCKDPARMYYGGTDIFYENFNAVITERLLDSKVSQLIIENDKSNNYSRKIKKLSPIDPKENLEKYKTFEPLKNISFDSIKQICPLTKAIVDDDYWVYHPEGFKLLTNLNRVTGASNKILPYLLSDTNSKHQNWDNIHKEIKRNKYCPESCNDLCHFYNTCPDNTSSLYSKLSKKIIQVKDIETRTVDDIRTDLNNIFLPLLEKENNFCIIKSPCGTGKTHSLIHSIKRLRQTKPEKSITIAVPTHHLKDEIYTLLTSEGIESVCKPKLNTKNLPEEIEAELKLCMAIGMEKKKQKTMRNHLFIKDIGSYLREYDNFRASDCNVKITTISDVVYNSNEITSDILYIDEDIIPYKIEYVEAEVKKIFEIYSYLNEKGHSLSKDVFSLYTELVDNTGKGIVLNVNSDFKENILNRIDQIKKICFENKIRINIEQILRTTAYIVTDHPVVGPMIFYSIENDFPNCKNIIITSATINKSIAESIFKPKQIEFIDTGMNELIGDLYQYADYSFSKRYFNDHLEKIGLAIPNFHEHLSEWIIITHKDKKSMFAFNSNKKHFGNIHGYNDLNGFNICIIGTPNKRDDLYKLFYTVIHGEIPENDNLQNRKVQNDYFSYRFFTFESAALQQIQFYFIETELMQAYGRARLNLNDNNVIVFSNYPIPQAKFIEINEVEEFLVID